MVGTKLDPRTALVANNVALLVVFLALNFFALWEVIPLLASQYAGEGLQLPYTTRLYVMTFNMLFSAYGLILAVVVLLPLTLWRRDLVVRWAKDARVSGAAAWLLIVGTLYVLVSYWYEAAI